MKTPTLDFSHVRRQAQLEKAAPGMLKALEQIADIAEGSRTVNSLPHIAKIARAAAAEAEGDA